MERDFKGIWIPKEIWLNKSLTMQEKLFLVEITSLDQEKGCYANNNYFANFFDISITRVSIVINNLVDKGLIASEILVNEGNKRILKTLANIPCIPSQTKVKDPRKQKFPHNNTINNKVNNSPYGDGELHFICREYATKNLDKFPKAFYVNFLEYWTAPLQIGVKKGQELWRTKETFQLASRLSTSYKMTFSKDGELPKPINKNKFIEADQPLT